jgi:hypothetical protein
MVQERAGIDRRSLLKKGAAAGGIVWAAPVVATFNTPAAASTPVPSTTSLSVFVLAIQIGTAIHHVKWETKQVGSQTFFDDGPPTACGSFGPPDCALSPARTTDTCPAGVTAVLNPDQTLTVTFPSGAAILQARQKCGPGCDVVTPQSTTATSATYPPCS